MDTFDAPQLPGAAPVQRRRFLQHSAAALGALSAPSVFAADDTIRIGYISPRTGPFAPFAEADEFILDQVRKSLADGLTIGGKTYKVEILARDDQTKEDRASKAIGGDPEHSQIANGIALVPEGRRLFADLTVEENLLVAAGAAKKIGRTGEWTPERLFKELPALDPLRSRPATALSGGQQQLVAIARSLVMKPLSLEACIKLLDMEMAKAYDRPVAIPKRSPGQSEAEYAKVVSLFRVPADQKQPLASVEYLFDPLGLNDKHPERKKDPADPFKLVEADIMLADNGDYASTPEQPNVRWYEVIHNLFPVLTRAYRGFTPEERERFDKDYNTNFLWAFAPMTKRSALTIVALHKAGVLNLHRVAPPTSTDKTPNPTVVKEGANVKSVTWKYIDYDRTVKTKSHPFMAVTTGLSANITQDISPLTQNQLKSGGYTNYDLTMASGLQKREGSIFLADDDTYEILDQKGHHSPARRGVGFFAHSNIWAIQAVPAVVPHAAKAVRLYVAEFAARVNGDPLKAVLHQTSYDPAQDPRVALQHAKL
jgi:hypothetical protein